MKTINFVLVSPGDVILTCAVFTLTGDGFSCWSGGGSSGWRKGSGGGGVPPTN